MTATDVLRLEEYRRKRERRLRRTLALHRGDRVRLLLLARMAEIARALRADRVVVAWINQDGVPEAHPWVVLDLASDVPRRQLDPNLMIRSWRTGLPGFSSAPVPGAGPGDDGREWCVSIGSDGFLLWFVLVEAGAGGVSLEVGEKERLMFLSGECGAVLFHGDLEPGEEAAGADVDALRGLWSPGDGEAMAREALVGLAADAVRDRLVPEPASLDRRLQVVGVLLSVFGDTAGSEAVRKAVRNGDPTGLARALFGTAGAWERRGAFGDAAEMYRLAYKAACQGGACLQGGRAARGLARMLRRLARWDEALEWYGVAREVARSCEEIGEEALALDGLASVHLGRGAVPRARKVLEEARELALRSGDADAVAAVGFSRMTVAHTEGRLDDAVALGWEAFKGSGSRQARLRALTALGGVFLAAGHLAAAEDAFAVVERQCGDAYYRVYALAGLARVASARRDRQAYEMALRRLREAGLETSAPELRAEVYLEQGDGYRELGEPRQARRWYRKACRVARSHSVNEYLIRAEDALQELDSMAAGASSRGEGVSSPEEGCPTREVDDSVVGDADLDEIRRSLVILRQSDVGEAEGTVAEAGRGPGSP